MKTKTLKLDGHTVTVDPPSGFLGLSRVLCKRDADGATVLDGAISRLNYGDEAEFIAAVRKWCRSVIEKRAPKERGGP